MKTGILTNAQNANVANIYYGAEEQVKLAYMAVKTEIMTQKVTNSSYDATQTIPENNVEKIKKIVKENLNAKDAGTDVTDGFTVGIGIAKGVPVIKITYVNSAIRKNAMGEMKPAEDGKVEYAIYIETQDATYKEIIPSTVSYGSKTEETVAVADDITIGEEKFRVIKKSEDGKKITAMPYYNLVLSASPIKQATKDNYRSAGTVSFSSVEIPTWNENENIKLDTNENNVKIPIENYEKYLKSLGANNVEVKIGRVYPASKGPAEIDDSEYIRSLSGLNPSGTGGFWLGSSDMYNASHVALIGGNGAIYGIYDYTISNNYGVRPVIVITLL